MIRDFQLDFEFHRGFLANFRNTHDITSRHKIEFGCPVRTDRQTDRQTDDGWTDWHPRMKIGEDARRWKIGTNCANQLEQIV